MSEILPPVGIPHGVSVNPKETEEMKRLLMSLNAIETGQPITSTTNFNDTGPSATINETSINPDVAAMKQILMNLDKSTVKATKKLMETASDDPDLMEALVTEKTIDGVKIGNYKILSKLLEGSSKTKSHDIVNAHGDLIADGLMVYEAAYGIVKLLNSGKTVKDPTIRRLMDLEESYTNYRQEALRAKKLYNSSIMAKNSVRADIFETKFETARDSALAVKDKIDKLTSSL